jgi:hypothetical protein
VYFGQTALAGKRLEKTEFAPAKRTGKQSSVGHRPKLSCCVAETSLDARGMQQNLLLLNTNLCNEAMLFPERGFLLRGGFKPVEKPIFTC